MIELRFDDAELGGGNSALGLLRASLIRIAKRLIYLIYLDADNEPFAEFRDGFWNRRDIHFIKIGLAGHATVRYTDENANPGVSLGLCESLNLVDGAIRDGDKLLAHFRSDLELWFSYSDASLWPTVVVESLD
jgi:hypothetical protein